MAFMADPLSLVPLAWSGGSAGVRWQLNPSRSGSCASGRAAGAQGLLRAGVSRLRQARWRPCQSSQSHGQGVLESAEGRGREAPLPLGIHLVAALGLRLWSPGKMWSLRLSESPGGTQRAWNQLQSQGVPRHRSSQHAEVLEAK